MMLMINVTKANLRKCGVFWLAILLFAVSIAQAQTSRSATYYNRGNDRYKKGDLDGGRRHSQVRLFLLS